MNATTTTRSTVTAHTVTAHTVTAHTTGRTKITIAGLAAVALLGTGCSAAAERATEFAYEQALESSTGEDVDLDLDFSDGSFSIETEEGTFSVDQNGDFVVQSEDGTLTGSANAGGFVIEDADGEFADLDGAATNLGSTSTPGDAPIDWSTWPSEVARPDMLGELDVVWFLSDGNFFGTATGFSPLPAADAVADYVADLEVTSEIDGIETEAFVLRTVTVGDHAVNVSADSLEPGRTMVTIMVGPNES